MSLSVTNLKDVLLNRVETAVRKAEYQSFKLVLVVIPQDSHREIQEELLNSSVRTINLSKELSRKLVSQSMKDRVKRLRMEVSDIAKECNESVWMSNLDVLFEPSLESDPMILLKKVAKSQVLVAIWPGEITETSLVYSKPGKQDYQYYLLKELNEIQVIDACNGVIK
ncbi:BREX-3 system P-loop-containing protein BrxF [Vibrio parahaemolyticus]